MPLFEGQLGTAQQRQSISFVCYRYCLIVTGNRHRHSHQQPGHATQALIEVKQKKMEEMNERIEALEVVRSERVILTDKARRTEKRGRR